MSGKAAVFDAIRVGNGGVLMGFNIMIRDLKKRPTTFAGQRAFWRLLANSEVSFAPVGALDLGGGWFQGLTPSGYWLSALWA
jgi:hypothetical protein